MQPMANIALRAARKAGDFMLRAMDRPEEFDIETKAPNDFVSNIDKTAEAIIVDQIRETYPDHAIIGEEFGAKSGNSEFTWIIDPLDGTLNFLQGIPHFAISIGIMKGRHHEHGIIYDPVRGEEFIASRGSGAQLNGKRIRVSARSKLEDCVLATGLPPGSVENRLDEYGWAQRPYWQLSGHPPRRQRSPRSSLRCGRAHRRLLGDGIKPVGHCRRHRLGSRGRRLC